METKQKEINEEMNGISIEDLKEVSCLKELSDEQFGKPTQIDPLSPNETDPPSPFQIDPLIPAQTDPLKR